MANYTDDFESYSAGSGLPTGWTSRWDSGTWSIVDVSGDNVLREAAGSANRYFASMDAIDGDADRANIELLGRIRTSNVSGAQPRIMLCGRGGGSGTGETGYCCGIYQDDLQLRKFVSGTLTTITTVGMTLSASTWYWLRFRINGTSLKARIWADGGSEPGTWDIDTTDSSISAAGWGGVFAFEGSINHDCADLAIATNGDTASMSSGPTYTLTAAAGSFSLTGNAAGLTAARQITAASGSYTLTGNAANLTAARLLTAANGSFVLTGNDATLTYTPSGATYTLTAASGSFGLTGNAASLLAGRKLTADSGTFTLTGNAAVLARGYSMTASAGSFTLTGNSAGLLASRLLNAERGIFVLTGNAATLSYGAAVSVELIYKLLANRQELNATTGTFTIYDDDDATVLLSANAWEDDAATIPYRGGALKRIDRLA